MPPPVAGVEDADGSEDSNATNEVEDAGDNNSDEVDDAANEDEDADDSNGNCVPDASDDKTDNDDNDSDGSNGPQWECLQQESAASGIAANRSAASRSGRTK